MKRVLSPLASLTFLLAACATPTAPPAPVTFPLANAGFEEKHPEGDCAPDWGCGAHADATSFRFFAGPGAPPSGASLCMEPVKNQPWAIVSQARFDRALRGKRLRFLLDVKLDAVTGHGAGAVVTAHGGHGERLDAKESVLTGTHDWRTLTVDFMVPAGAAEVDVGGILQGRGRLCIDNARVEVLP
jgi:hypothetical protein